MFAFNLLLLKKDDNSDKAEEEIEEELKRTSEIRSLAIKESTELFLMLECSFEQAPDLIIT